MGDKVGVPIKVVVKRRGDKLVTLTVILRKPIDI